MKFLLDECTSIRLGALVRDDGHDVVHVIECGLAGKTDEVVMAFARDERRVLISVDTDFGELLVRSGESLPSVILFRQGNRSPEHQAGVLRSNLEAITSALEVGSFVVFSNSRIRVRTLPLGN